MKLVEAVRSNDVVVSFIKGGDHVLEEEEDFQRMWSSIVEVAEAYYEYDLTSPSSG